MLFKLPPAKPVKSVYLVIKPSSVHIFHIYEAVGNWS